MKKEDFTLLRVDRKGGHEDYWYETSKAANEYLTDKYMEQSMKAVFRVVYSKDEDIVGVEGCVGGTSYGESLGACLCAVEDNTCSGRDNLCVDTLELNGVVVS